MAKNWWESDKPLDQSMIESTVQNAKSNWFESDPPVAQNARKQKKETSFEDLFGAPLSPQTAEMYKAATMLPGEAAFIVGKGAAKAAVNPDTYKNLTKTIPEMFGQAFTSSKLQNADSLPDSIMTPIPSLAVDTPSQAMEFWKSFGVTSDEELRRYKQELQKSSLQEISASRERVRKLTPKNLDIYQQGIRGGITSGAIMAPGAALSIVAKSPAPALAAAGAIEGLSGYGEARLEGKSAGAALAYGGINSIIEVATEIAPTGKLLDALGASSVSGLKKKLLDFATSEILTEQAATALQSLNGVMFGLDEEIANAKDIGEIARIQAERQAITAISTIVAGGAQAGAVGAINRIQEEAVRRNIESQTRDIEGVGSALERERIMEIRSKALDDAKAIAAPPIDQMGVSPGQQPNDLQFGTAYAQRIFDSVGHYVPEDAEFKVEEKDTDVGKQYAVVDQKGRQFGKTLANKSQASALSEGLNNTAKERAKVLAQLRPVQESLQKTLEGFGLNDIGLSIDRRVFNREGQALTSEGLFDPVVRQVFLAVDAIDPDGTLTTEQRRDALKGVLRHEVVHALRYLDLWKKSEWKNLEKAAATVIKPGTDKTYLQIAQENYADQSDVIKAEESVSELIRDVAARRSNIAGRPRTLSERAINFFDKAKNAITGSGFQTYEDIVQRFERGDIGARERGRIRTYRATEERMSEMGRNPERIQQLFSNAAARNQAREKIAQDISGGQPPANPIDAEAVRINAIRESRSVIDPVPPTIEVDGKQFPTVDFDGKQIYSGYEGEDIYGFPILPTMQGLKNFWKNFKNSKAVDEFGRPLLYLHGTARDILSFQPKQAGATFLTLRPSFADDFTRMSQDYMVQNFQDFMSDEDLEAVASELLKIAKENQKRAAKSNARIQSLNKLYQAATGSSNDQWMKTQARQDVGYLEYVSNSIRADIAAGKPVSNNAIKALKAVLTDRETLIPLIDRIDAFTNRLPTGRNIMPVYANIEDPFDYRDPASIKRLSDKWNEMFPSRIEEGNLLSQILEGRWDAIEGTAVIKAIKAAGFDSFYVVEDGVRNLGIFNPNNIKSAIGNDGNFDVYKPSIRESRNGKKSLNARLRDEGVQVDNIVNALSRWNAGERMFAFPEMDEAPIEVKDIDTLMGYAPEQLLALPEEKVSGKEIARRMAAVPSVGESRTDSSRLFVDALIEKNRVPLYGSREKLIDMNIDDFLMLAEKGFSNSKYEGVKKLMDEGEKFYSLPFLNAYADGKDFLKVRGHEGRHRARALKEAGYQTMPVILRTDIRWSFQNDPSNRYDYVENWPTRIESEDSDRSIPMPVSREESMAPYGGIAPAIRESRIGFPGRPDQVVTPEFKEWFRDSEATEQNGQPLVLYTGTSKDFDFKAFKIPKRGAWFSTSPSEASGFAIENDSQRMVLDREKGPWAYKEINTSSRVIPVYLRAENPKVYKGSELRDEIFKRGKENYARGEGMLFDELRMQGHDSVRLKSDDGYDTWVVLDNPNQIKSAISNTGAFSEAPGIRESRVAGSDRAESKLWYDKDKPYESREQRTRRAGEVAQSAIAARESRVGSEQPGVRGGLDQGRAIAPLEGAPNVVGGGPIPEIVAAAENYAAQRGLPYSRQPSYVRVDEGRATRIANAYEQMANDPTDPKVIEAYRDLIDQTRAQYDALVDAGYTFTFFDSNTDPYDGNPWNAMRDLRSNKSMAVYGTYDGYGTEGITDSELDNNPMLEDTGLRWKDQNGIDRMVTANDLFRAVHDAFGHGIEGAGFRPQGEENAWQAHARLFTGPALAALTSETRGQNSWLNFNTKLLREMVGDEKAKALHPDNWETITTGEHNRTANLKETIFSEQKTGLMPDWTWQEGFERISDGQVSEAATFAAPGIRESRRIRSLESAPRPRRGGGVTLSRNRQADATSAVGVHYGNVGGLTSLSARRYGEGIRGVERSRVTDKFADPRLKKRVYFYINYGDLSEAENGKLPLPEVGLSNNLYSQQFDNILFPGPKMSSLQEKAERRAERDQMPFYEQNYFESYIIDAGYDGYAVPEMGMMVILNHNTPVDFEGTVEGVGASAKINRQSAAPRARESRNIPPDLDRLNAEGWTSTGDINSVDSNDERSISLRTEIKKAKRLLDKGVITETEFSERVARILEKTKKVPKVKDRLRGAEIIKQKLITASRRGEISKEGADLAMWFIDKNPAIADDLAISIRLGEPIIPGRPVVEGNYIPSEMLVSIFKFFEPGFQSEIVAVHEVLHHVERMMPTDIRADIFKSFAVQLHHARKNAPEGTKMREALDHLVDYHFNFDREAYAKARDSMQNLREGSYLTLYQYTNPSEFWAVNSSRIMQGRYGVSKSTIGKIKLWLKEFIEKIKDMLGLPSDAPIIRALESVIKGDGKIRPFARMLREEGFHIIPFIPRERQSVMPGPSSNTDGTSAAEDLNDGEPVNSMGNPTGPRIISTAPNGTVDISDAKLDSITRRLLTGLEFVQSASDKLRGGVGLEELAWRVENYYDSFNSRLGIANGIIRDAYKTIGFRDKDAATETFERYIRERENKRYQEARDIYINATESERALIDAWDKIADVTGAINLSVRTPDGEPMKVWDAQINAWRPIRAVRDFFPRSLRREVMMVMKNPDLDPQLWDQLLDALVIDGRVADRDEAKDYLVRQYFADEVKQDYFAGVEKARSEPLPEIFYDYSWDSATRYIRKWARRTSQIENFGQELGPFKKEWFGRSIPKIRDEETQNYVAAIRDRIYEVEEFDVVSNMMNWANSLATGLQLGNWVSSGMNLIGGMTTNVQEFGLVDASKAFVQLVKDWKSVQREGTHLGILNKDFINILSDHVERDAGRYWSQNETVSEGLAKFASFMLTYGGYNAAENAVRGVAFVAARANLMKSLDAINNNPGSSVAKKFVEWVQRQNLSLDALLSEDGAGPETDKYMRRAVNVPQGSYDITMTPVFIDSPIGRFFFKYQKFGTQINRFFYMNFLKPFATKPTPRNFMRAVGFVATGLVGGGMALAFREALGYGDAGPDEEEIEKALKNKDTARAWSLILSRAWQNLIAAGSLGFYGNYAQLAKDWQDQERVKNPLSPPGLSSVNAVIDLFARVRDQGMLTAKDLEEIAESTISYYRAGKRFTLSAGEAIGADGKAVKKFSAGKNLREVRELGRRYSTEMNIEFKRTSPAGIPIRTEMTPYNKQIVDALYINRPDIARRLIKEVKAGKPSVEREKIENSIRAAIRNRQPIQIGGSAPSEKERRDFIKWARRNTSAEQYQMILTMDKNYQRNASRIGMGFGGD